MFKNMLRCFWLAGFELHVMLMSHHWAWEPSDHGTEHTAHHFLSCLLLLSSGVRHECKINWWLINLSVCGSPKYTYRPCWSGKMHIISKLFDWPRLLCCFCWLGWYISWAEHVHGTLKVSQRFTPNFPIFLFCLSFGSSSRHHNRCNIYLKICITHWTAGFEMSCHDKTCGQFSVPCFCIKNVSVCDYYSQTLFTDSVHKDCSYIKNRPKTFVRLLLCAFSVLMPQHCTKWEMWRCNGQRADVTRTQPEFDLGLQHQKYAARFSGRPPSGLLVLPVCIVDSEWPSGWDTLDSDYPWTWHTGSWLAADWVPSPSPIP